MQTISSLRGRKVKAAGGRCSGQVNLWYLPAVA